MKIARAVFRSKGEGPPDLRHAAIKYAAFRQDADHGMRLIVEQERAFQDRGFAAELALPKRVTDNHDPVVAGLVLAGREGPSHRSLNAKDLEVIGRDPKTGSLRRPIDAGQRHGTAHER